MNHMHACTLCMPTVCLLTSNIISTSGGASEVNVTFTVMPSSSFPGTVKELCRLPLAEPEYICSEFSCNALRCE